MSEQKKPFNSAFAQLGAMKKQLESAEAEKQKALEAQRARAAQEAAQRAKGRPAESDADAFLRAMSGVKKLGDDGRGEVVRASAVPQPRAAVDAAADDVQALIDLASSIDSERMLGSGRATDGVWCAQGLDTRIVKRLRGGDFALDAELDLHGQRRADAELSLTKFVKGARAQKLRCVLVVTGKGLHSDPGGPVLRDAVVEWLARGKLVPHVLAVSVAQPKHGGDGAFYVLLRRR